MSRNTLAALIAGLFTLPVQAQQTPLLDEIVVTATRIATPIRDSLSDVSVLDRAAIEHMDHVALPEQLGTLPGIQLTTAGGRGTYPLSPCAGGMQVMSRYSLMACAFPPPPSERPRFM